MAELADAHGSGPCGRNTLWVRLPSSAVQVDGRLDEFSVYFYSCGKLVSKLLQMHQIILENPGTLNENIRKAPERQGILCLH